MLGLFVLFVWVGFAFWVLICGFWVVVLGWFVGLLFCLGWFGCCDVIVCGGWVWVGLICCVCLFVFLVGVWS